MRPRGTHRPAGVLEELHRPTPPAEGRHWDVRPAERLCLTGSGRNGPF
jgi:hypothetical protein